MRFYLVRHAQSENNARPESERQHDPAITSIGAVQARNVAQRIASEVEFDQLITSGFRRALMTCEAIAKTTGKTPEVVVDIHESGGCYAGWMLGELVGMPGMSAEEINEQFGPIKIPQELGSKGWWNSRPYEVYSQLVARAERVSDYFSSRIDAEQKVMLCVSHADFIAQFLKVAIGEAVLDDPNFYRLKNTGLTCLDWDGKKWSSVFINSDSHLSTEIVTE